MDVLPKALRQVHADQKRRSRQTIEAHYVSQQPQRRYEIFSKVVRPIGLTHGDQRRVPFQLQGS